MDPDLNAIREAIAALLNDAIADLSASARWPGVINAPAAVVVRRQTRYAPTFDLPAETSLGIRVFAAVALNDQAAAEDLDDYLAATGPRSIPAALATDPTLGGLVDFLHVATAEEDQVVSHKGIDYLAADLILEVG